MKQNEARKMIRLTLIVSIAMLSFSGCSTYAQTNYSGEGACSSLESLMDQLRFMEISDTDTFYAQLYSIKTQAIAAAEIDDVFKGMAKQIESFGKVWLENYPDAVPNATGVIPLEYTSDTYCGTNYFGENQ